MANPVLSGITEGLLNQEGPLWQGLEEKRKKEQKLKDEAREFKLAALQQAWSQPGVSQEVRDQIGKDIQGLLPPDAKKTHGKVSQLIGGLFGAIQPKAQPQMSQPSPQEGLSKPQVSGGDIFGDISKAYGQAQTPKDATIAAREKGYEEYQNLEKRGPKPGQSPQDYEKEKQELKDKLGFIYGSGKFEGDKIPASVQAMREKRRQLVEDVTKAAKLHGQDLSPEQAEDLAADMEVSARNNQIIGTLKPQAFEYTNETGQKETVYGFLGKGGKFYDQESKQIPIPKGAIPVPKDTKLYANAGTIVAAEDALNNVRLGLDHYYHPNGQEFTQEELLQLEARNETLYPVVSRGDKTVYGVGGAQPFVYTTDNERYIVPRAGFQHYLKEGAPGAQGQAVVGTTRSTSTTGEESTTVTRPNAPSQGAPPPQAPGKAPSKPPVGNAPLGPGRQLTRNPPPGSFWAAPEIHAASPAILNAVNVRQTSVNETARQILGSPDGDYNSLNDYRDLADSEGSRDRLKNAITLADDTYDQLRGQGSFSDLHAGKVLSVGFGGWLQAKLGVQASTAKNLAQSLSNAMTDLRPREQEYFDRLMDARAAVVGLRSITRASGAQFSVEAIEKDVPEIGRNTFSSHGFENKVGGIAEIMESAMETTVIKGAFSPDQKSFVHGFTALKPKKGQALSKPRVSDPQQDDIMKKLDATFNSGR